jgi:hypothetical protein
VAQRDDLPRDRDGEERHERDELAAPFAEKTAA